MARYRRRIARLVALVSVFAITVSLYAGSAPVSHAATMDQITVGTGIDPGFAHFYIAKQLGFWQKRGLDVQVKLFAAGAAAFTSIIAGDIVAADGGATGCILAAARSPKVVLVSSSYESDRYYGMVTTSQITSPQQLKGKKSAPLSAATPNFLLMNS